MENEINNQSRNNNICLSIIFWIYTTVHLVIFLYNTDTNKIDIFLALLFIFISFLLTTIFVTVNICKNIFKYLCLILSSINELIFICLLIFIIAIICSFPGSDAGISIIILIFLFLIESLPNIILFAHFHLKSKNENSQNIENNNNNSRLINIELN